MENHPMPPTIEEKYQHLRDNAEAFVASMKTMVTALERDGKTEEATNLRVWCLMPWQAAIRDDDSGELWTLCEACGGPIKNPDDAVAGEDFTLHRACAQ